MLLLGEVEPGESGKTAVFSVASGLRSNPQAGGTTSTPIRIEFHLPVFRRPAGPNESEKIPLKTREIPAGAGHGGPAFWAAPDRRVGRQTSTRPNFWSDPVGIVVKT